MIPETTVPSCLRARRQRITQASRFARSAQRGQAARSSATCREDASEGGATVARTSTHGSWAAHLYDHHRYYEPAQTVPTVAGVIEQDDSWLETVLGVALVLVPWMMALVGWSM